MGFNLGFKGLIMAAVKGKYENTGAIMPYLQLMTLELETIQYEVFHQ